VTIEHPPLPFVRRKGPIPAVKTRAYYASHFPIRRDLDGTRLCKWCGDKVPKPRRDWCSEACVKEFNLLSMLDRLIYQRDGGKCRGCGLDFGKLQRIDNAYRGFCHEWDGILRALDRPTPYYWYRGIWEQMGLADRRGHLWEIDHIRPMSLGGLTHPDNLRLLCIECHKAETKKLAGVLAKSRRREKKLKAHQQALLDED
jgi:5-methylcytosine-specific restriction endonuclease McrA